MNDDQRIVGVENLGLTWPMVLARGSIMLVSGLFIGLASLFNPDGSIMHGSEFSWLPVSGGVIILVGLIETYETYASKDLGQYFLHLQGAALDLVNGSLIFFSISGAPDRLSLLIVAYLMVKAILRLMMSHAVKLPQRRSITFGAGISILLGVLIWAHWPSPGAWFMSLCLGIDITLRGWSQILFSFWLKAQSGTASSSSQI